MEDENEDVEVLEVNMDMEDIGEMIGKLNELMESKGKTEIDIADDVQLVINYVEEDGGEE